MQLGIETLPPCTELSHIAIFMIFHTKKGLCCSTCTLTIFQREVLRQRELQAQQQEEQRTQFKMKTQNLLHFAEHSPDIKSSRKKVTFACRVSCECFTNVNRLWEGKGPAEEHHSEYLWKTAMYMSLV